MLGSTMLTQDQVGDDAPGAPGREFLFFILKTIDSVAECQRENAPFSVPKAVSSFFEAANKTRLWTTAFNAGEAAMPLNQSVDSSLASAVGTSRESGIPG